MCLSAPISCECPCDLSWSPDMPDVTNSTRLLCNSFLCAGTRSIGDPPLNSGQRYVPSSWVLGDAGGACGACTLFLIPPQYVVAGLSLHRHLIRRRGLARQRQGEHLATNQAQPTFNSLIPFARRTATPPCSTRTVLRNWLVETALDAGRRCHVPTI